MASAVTGRRSDQLNHQTVWGSPDRVFLYCPFLREGWPYGVSHPMLCRRGSFPSAPAGSDPDRTRTGGLRRDRAASYSSRLLGHVRTGRKCLDPTVPLYNCLSLSGWALQESNLVLRIFSPLRAPATPKALLPVVDGRMFCQVSGYTLSKLPAVKTSDLMASPPFFLSLETARSMSSCTII